MLPLVGMPRIAAVVLAAGFGDRLRAGEPKAFLEVGGVPMLVQAAESCASAVDLIIIAVPPGMQERARALTGEIVELGGGLSVEVVEGGVSRQASVRAALRAVPDGVQVVAVHDAARPFATRELWARVLDALASGADGAIPVLPVPDTVKRVRAGAVVDTSDRDELALAQTPQAFRADVLRDAHDRAEAEGLDLTDDAAVVEWAGYRVVTVEGDATNVKITTAHDLERAGSHRLAVVTPRIGLGFDVHPTSQGRELHLGGVLFEDADGLAGHSDGDVVCHAVADALLGAAALGDVGVHFPDTDPALAGIGGLELLGRTLGRLEEAGLTPARCDVTVICERPTIAPRRDEMRERLASALRVPLDRVSIKATRPEGLGLSGDGVGCIAIAVLM